MNESSPHIVSTEEEIASHAHQERLDQFWDRIDDKVDAVLEIIDAIDTLPPPAGEESQNDIMDENQRLLQVSEPIFNNLSKSKRSSFEHYSELEDQIKYQGSRVVDSDDESLYSNYTQLEQLENERDGIRKDTDIDFALRVTDGIHGIISRREALRTLLQDMGDQKLDPNFYNNEYTHITANAATRVVIMNCSINIFVKSEYFKKMYGSQNGVHIAKSPFNVINEHVYPSAHERLVLSVFGKPQYPPISKRQSVTLKHENAHSLLEGFMPEYNFNPKYVNSAAKRLKNAIEKKYPAYIRGREADLIIRRIRKFADNGHEELIAELVSKPYSDRTDSFPNSTFASRVSGFLSEIEAFRGIAPEVDLEIDKVRKRMDIHEVRQKIQSLYSLVEDAYQDDIVESERALLRLDCALILFKPSQFRHIQRWVTQHVIKQPNDYNNNDDSDYFLF